MNCRLCLIECTYENAYALFGYNSDITWVQIIHKYLNIKIEEADTYSTTVCHNCFHQLSGFQSFCYYVEQRQFELEKLLTAQEPEPGRNELCLTKVKTETFEDENLTELADFQTEPITSSLETNYDEQNERNINNNVIVQNEATNEFTDSQFHWDVGENDDDRMCVLCNKLHKNFKALQSHMYKIHNNIKPFSCNRCGLQFRFRPSLSRHLLNCKHENKGATIHAKIKDINERTCVICNKVHKSLRSLKRHIYRFHNSENPFKCQKCGIGFRLEITLKKHLDNKLCRKSSKHNAIHAFDNLKDRTCGICQKRCKTVDALSSHMYQSHKGEKPFACSTCGLRFRLRGTFLRHFWKCSGFTPTENMETSTSENLENSTNIISNTSQSFENSYIIPNDTSEPFENSNNFESKTKPDLGNSINSKKTTNQSIKNPTKDIEYRTCVLCTLVFDKVSTLFQHMCTEHKDIKPFSCQECNKTFILKRAFENHFTRNCIKPKHEKNIPCNICNKFFKNRKSLNTHKYKIHFSVRQNVLSENPMEIDEKEFVQPKTEVFEKPNFLIMEDCNSALEYDEKIPIIPEYNYVDN